ITGSREVSSSDLNKIKIKLEMMIDYLYSRIMDYRNYVTEDELLKIHTEILEEFMRISIEGIPCLKPIKENGINGQQLEDIIITHTNRLKDVFRFHVTKFNCNGSKSPKKSMNPDKLDMAIVKILSEMKKAFDELLYITKDLSIDQAKEVYTAGFTKIYTLHADNVPCFQVAKTMPINGKNSAELEAFHVNKFKKNLDMHINMFGCK
ncbi:MAG: hypothetical protein RR645_04130, partial [Clostridium sp.]